jgi:pyridoxamine 5'-phosphate oxidase
MIEFKNKNQGMPYLILDEKYRQAIKSGQDNVEAMVISSFNKTKNEVDSRFVNLKFIDNDRLIFFSNYNSSKSIAFNTFNQISALLYWPTINTQIRIKANVVKTTVEFNKKYFKKRDIYKNALAISSNQSSQIKSYEEVSKNYLDTLKINNLDECPKYWGGYAFTPYYFEFWEGHDSRINKREVFDKINGAWKQTFLQP